MRPSEIATALKTEYEAIKKQGKHTDLMLNLEEILAENDEKIQEKNTDLSSNQATESTSDQVGRKLEYSERNIQIFY